MDIRNAQTIANKILDRVCGYSYWEIPDRNYTAQEIESYAAARVAEAVAPYKALEKAARAHDEATYHDERCATRRKLREAIENLDKVLAALPAAHIEGEPV